MPVMLQVRNLPDDVHAKLKKRAAEARMSLSDYVAAQLAEIVSYRPNSEIIAEMREVVGNKLKPGDAARVVREIRGPLV